MTDRYKESIQGARDCVERNKDGGVYLPDLLVVIDSQQTQIDTMLEDLQFRTNQVIEQQAEIERLNNEVIAKEYEYNDMLEQRNSVEYNLELLKQEKSVVIAEAIKEFIEKLKDLSYESDLYDRNERWVKAVTVEEIDETYKEMGLE